LNLDAAYILIVDDEPELLEVFQAWIAAAGCPNVSTAPDGMEALELCTHTPFDLIISDINMPRMDGITLLRNLFKRGQHMPSIIFVSGFDAVDRAELRELGVDAFLAKPVRRKELLLAVETALALRNLHSR
jgi:CheY-like chemotaxis protein